MRHCHSGSIFCQKKISIRAWCFLLVFFFLGIDCYALSPASELKKDSEACRLLPTTKAYQEALNKDYHVFIFDVGDTLGTIDKATREKEKIQPDMWDLLLKLMKEGKYVVLCSSRSFCSGGKVDKNRKDLLYRYEELLEQLKNHPDDQDQILSKFILAPDQGAYWVKGSDVKFFNKRSNDTVVPDAYKYDHIGGDWRFSMDLQTYVQQRFPLEIKDVADANGLKVEVVPKKDGYTFSIKFTGANAEDNKTIFRDKLKKCIKEYLVKKEHCTETSADEKFDIQETRPEGVLSLAPTLKGLNKGRMVDNIRHFVAKLQSTPDQTFVACFGDNGEPNGNDWDLLSLADGSFSVEHADPDSPRMIPTKMLPGFESLADGPQRTKKILNDWFRQKQIQAAA